MFNPAKPEDSVWSSTTLEDFSTLNDEGRSFTAKGVSVTLSDDYLSYALKITINPQTIVDFTITRDAPAFKIGKDGYTIYGTDEAKPWGTMRHLFWPRCTVSGVILIKGAPLDVSGRGQVIHAIQGMKPHHAASKWNFALFVSEKVSATMMEFTTPESYGSVKVSVGGISEDGNVIAATVDNVAQHVTSRLDQDTQWEEPTEVEFIWNGVTKEKVPVKGTIHSKLSPRLERVDVLAEIPPWLKKIAHGVSGTKPFIYQFAQEATLDLTIGGETQTHTGTLFVEATFIS